MLRSWYKTVLEKSLINLRIYKIYYAACTIHSGGWSLQFTVSSKLTSLHSNLESIWQNWGKHWIYRLYHTFIEWAWLCEEFIFFMCIFDLLSSSSSSWSDDHLLVHHQAKSDGVEEELGLPPANKAHRMAILILVRKEPLSWMTSQVPQPLCSWK